MKALPVNPAPVAVSVSGSFVMLISALAFPLPRSWKVYGYPLLVLALGRIV